MHTIKAVIFDLDGTLLDTEDISTRATEMVLSSCTDARIDWATKQQILGMRSEDWGNFLIRKYQLDDKLSTTHLVSEWEKNMGMRVKIECFLSYDLMTFRITTGLLCNEMEEMIGADKLTRDFSTLGIPMAIATSSSYDSFEKKRQFHKELFERVKVVVCGDDMRVQNGKPAPDIYLLAGFGSSNYVNESPCV
jgi:pseudouridine-5'-monophosphatase